jgi:hypothetical protein
MGVSYSTHIVVGFDASDAIKVKKELISQRKYNEDTGVPYIKETPNEKKYFGSIDITETCLEDFVSKSMPGMDIYRADYEDENGKVIIGVPIKTLDKPCVSELKITGIDSIRQQVKIQIMSSAKLDIEPSVFVVFHCSY